MLDIDPSTIVAAAIAAAPPTFAIIMRSKGMGKKVDELHDEVRTNHGKRQGEYIEQLADGQAVQSALLLAHTRQDESRFSALERSLAANATKTDVDALRSLMESYLRDRKESS